MKGKRKGVDMPGFRGATCILAQLKAFAIHWLSWGFKLSPGTWGGFWPGGRVGVQ